MSFDTRRASAYHCAPMLTSRLPGRVEPYKLAAQAEHLEGLVALADMSRLTEEVGAQQGDASACPRASRAQGEGGTPRKGLRHLDGPWIPRDLRGFCRDYKFLTHS